MSNSMCLSAVCLPLIETLKNNAYIHQMYPHWRRASMNVTSRETKRKTNFKKL